MRERLIALIGQEWPHRHDSFSMRLVMRSHIRTLQDLGSKQVRCVATMPAWLAHEREEWDACCHLCDGPAYPWWTDDRIWAKVDSLLGHSQVCFECFSAAWFALGLNNGEPFSVSIPGPKVDDETQ